LNRWLFNAAALSAVLMGSAPILLAAESASDGVLACAAEADDDRRLACFDALAAGLRGDPRPAAAAAPAAAAPAATAPAATAPAAAAPVAAAPVAAAPVAAATTMGSPAAAPPPTAAAEQPSEAGTPSPEDRFGLRVDTKQQKADELTELSATATAISAKLRGELVITLDNGQVWGEIAPGSKIKVKPGDAVKIEAGTLGSFILIAPNGRSSKVTRIR
jgi:hypothetical protein